MGRTVTLVLVDAAGVGLGTLPPFPVPSPWWPDVDEVVAGAQDRYGLEVTVLRLLGSDRPAPHGGAVSYLAEVAAAPPGGPGGQRLRPGVVAPPVAPSEAPRRAPWAVPGGPRAAVAWALDQLAGTGHRGVRSVQQRTWNLSSIWRFDIDGSPVAWLKQVPAFAVHEAAVLRFVGALRPGATPPLLAVGDAGRQLLQHVPGRDCHGAPLPQRVAVAADMHAIQAAAAARVTELLAAGVPDLRSAVLSQRIRAVLARDGAPVPGLRRLVDGLDDRLAEVAACGLPDTLVHGDLHPGNVRCDDARRVIVDWADACVGHPGFDILRLAEGLPAGEARALLLEWARWWRARVPASDPQRAVTLLRPVAALRNAVVYAGFLDGIEESEWPYHAADVGLQLRAAVAAAG